MSTPNCKIMPCTCHNEFQDQRYGKKNRVFNLRPKKDKQLQEGRCTVCLKTKVVPTDK